MSRSDDTPYGVRDKDFLSPLPKIKGESKTLCQVKRFFLIATILITKGIKKTKV